MSDSQADGVRDGVYHVLEKLRPNAVALVDSWDFSDREVCFVYELFGGPHLKSTIVGPPACIV